MLAMPPVVTSVARARALGVSSVGEQAILLLTFVPGGLERSFVPRDGERPDPAAFGLTFPETAGAADVSRRAAEVSRCDAGVSPSDPGLSPRAPAVVRSRRPAA
jgi:hypothetical protein